MQKLIIANWKMQLNYKESLALAKKFSQKISTKNNRIVVCPGYPSLVGVVEIVKKKGIEVGAQDCALEDLGAYTGEVSPKDLQKMQVKYVILGHSERRQYLQEGSAVINGKIIAALRNNLIPVLCIGESLMTKEQGETKKFLIKQLRQGLKNVKIGNTKDLVVAYEPLWAIGTGRAIIPMEAEIMHSFIKKEVSKILKKNIKVIYGGSVNSQNAMDFLVNKNVDGLLVGGASLKVNEFSKICQL